MKDLTVRQRDVLRYCVGRQCATGRMPSVRTIMERFGWVSTHSVHDHLLYIAKKGYITRGPTGKFVQARVRRWPVGDRKVLDYTLIKCAIELALAPFLDPEDKTSERRSVITEAMQSVMGMLP